MSISRDALLKPIEAKRVKVDLPEFGEGQFAYAYALTAGQYIDIERSMLSKDGTKVDFDRSREMKQRQVIASLGDEDGNRLLTLDDLETVNAWPSELFERVHDAVFALAGKKQVTEKNSEQTSD